MHECLQEKWKELQKQIAKAVQPDSLLRVFYCGTFPHPPVPNVLEGPVDMGLVFKCTRGTVELQESGICGTRYYWARSVKICKKRGTWAAWNVCKLCGTGDNITVVYVWPPSRWGIPLDGLMMTHGRSAVYMFQRVASDAVMQAVFMHAGVVLRSPAGNVEARVRRELLTQEPHLLPQLFTHARNAWLVAGHPGWGVFKFQGAACADIPHIFFESAPSQQHTTYSYPCEASLIACYTPPAGSTQPVQEPAHEAGTSTGPPQDAANGAVVGVANGEIDVRGVSGDIFAMPSPDKVPEHVDLFHLSTDPLAPAAPPDGDGDVRICALHALDGANGAGADVGASVFDSVSFKGLSGVTNLSSLFASAVSLPPDENNASEPTPPVVNWMATTSNAMNMGVNVSVSPVNVFPHAAHGAGGATESTLGGTGVASSAPCHTSVFTDIQVSCRKEFV